MRKTPKMNYAARPIFGLLAVAIVATCLPAGTNPERIPFPTEFRKWTHVKSAMITAAHPAAATEGGIHHIYANSQAAQGYASGHFANGSMVVYELLETSEKDGVISEGPRRRVDVMVKDSARFGSTGGWGFERFRTEPASTQSEGLSEQARTACFECHRQAAGHDSVFSRMR